MREVLSIAKALSDEGRLRAVLALDDGEMCVCQLIELLGLAPSTVSKHMSILHQAGLVETRKDGRWIYYRLADGSAASGAMRWLREALATDGHAAADARRADEIRLQPVQELCSHYHPNRENP